jgi:hypothetical protein
VSTGDDVGTNVWAATAMRVMGQKVKASFYVANLYRPETVNIMPKHHKLRLFMASFPYGVNLCPGDGKATTFDQAVNVFNTWHGMTSSAYYTFVVSVNMWTVGEIRKAIQITAPVKICGDVELVVWAKSNRKPFNGNGFDRDVV